MFEHPNLYLIYLFNWVRVTERNKDLIQIYILQKRPTRKRLPIGQLNSPATTKSKTSD